MPGIPCGPVKPVGPSIPSKFTLYITLESNVPDKLVMFFIIIEPVIELYDCTVPSKLLFASLALIIITEFPGIYANNVPTVIDMLPPKVGVIKIEVVAVKNLSPDIPVGPVIHGPVEPVLPGCPVGPVIVDVAPVGPVIPLGPVHPVGPVIVDVAPVGPVIPVGPVEPVRPVLPVLPVEPVGPVLPVLPVKPVLPVLPV